ncbi:MAG: hypothetical protein JWO03_4070 [Bacteroidetes bacterium]|nr:hypothetical protein [Bacteroidota bacterium]
MRKNVLFLLLLAVVKLTSAQYCGTSNSSICSPTSTLTTFGMSDYNTFPCVHDSVAYSEVIEVYIPDTIVQFGQHVTVYSVILDSIVGLPCGLCWSCNDPAFTYAGGSRGCIRISGTTNDVNGAYQIGIYGRAVTNLGTFPGNFDAIGFQFFLNVVGQHDNCAPIDILNLHTPCQGPPADSICHYHVNLASTPISTCPYTSTTISVTNLSAPNYHFYWRAIDSTFFNPRIDSVASVFTVYRSDIFLTLSVTDSLGCRQNINLANTDGGPIASPTICYATTDSGQASGTVKIMFERDNFFNNVASYQIFRADTQWQTSQYLVGASSGSVGYVIDSFPVSQGINSYSISVIPSCVVTFQGVGGNQYIRSVLSVDTFGSGGYPAVHWTNSDPMNYDQIYIYSKGSSGHWRLRYSSINLTNTGWLDLTPDSTRVEYMLGYRINSSCDPSRSSVTAFSNFAGVDVTPDKVVPDTTHSGPSSIASVSRGGVSVYPNPANDKLYIQLSETGSADMNVYDVEGRLMMNKALNGANINEINVSNLTVGVYVISLNQNGNEIAKRRFLKQ